MYEELATPEGIRALIQRKEVEVTRLREQRSFQLEKQLAEQRDELLQTQTKLQKLQDDFMYNLRLLDERDRELETYDREYTRLQAEAGEKDKDLVETRTALAGYESEVKQAKLQASEAENQFRQKAMELREAAETARFGKEEALLRQKEDFDRERRELGRRINDFEDELDTSRREISASFREKMQQMAAEHKARVAEAEEKAERAEKMRSSCMEQLDQARSKENHASELREEADARSLELQRKVDSLTFDLTNAEKAREEESEQSKTDLEEMKRAHLRDLEHERIKAEDESAKARSLDTMLAHEKEEAASRLQRQQEAWVTESASLRGRMETAEIRQKQAEEHLEEASSAFRIAKRDLEDKLAQAIAERDALERAHERSAAEDARTHEATARELREQLWSKDQELSALRGKVAFMKRALDERREDISTFKAQIVAGNEKSRDLNRQLIASQLQAEADIDSKEAAALASSQTLMKQLTDERDRALKVANIVEDRAARAEAEAARLQGELRALMAQKDGGAGGGGALVTPRLHLDLPPTSARSGKAASMLTISDVPSPPTLPTMGMGTTQLLGMTGGEAIGANSSDDGMTPRRDLSAAFEGTHKTPGGDTASLEAQNRGLRTSLAQMEGENERLKHSVAILRSEMESMQHESHRPSELSLKAELSAFEQDVQRASQYIRSAAGADFCGGLGGRPGRGALLEGPCERAPRGEPWAAEGDPARQERNAGNGPRRRPPLGAGVWRRRQRICLEQQPGNSGAEEPPGKSQGGAEARRRGCPGPQRDGVRVAELPTGPPRVRRGRGVFPRQGPAVGVDGGQRHRHPFGDGARPRDGNQQLPEGRARQNIAAAGASRGARRRLPQPPAGYAARCSGARPSRSARGP